MVLSVNWCGKKNNLNDWVEKSDGREKQRKKWKEKKHNLNTDIKVWEGTSWKISVINPKLLLSLFYFWQCVTARLKKKLDSKHPKHCFHRIDLFIDFIDSFIIHSPIFTQNNWPDFVDWNTIKQNQQKFVWGCCSFFCFSFVAYM